MEKKFYKSRFSISLECLYSSRNWIKVSIVHFAAQSIYIMFALQTTLNPNKTGRGGHHTAPIWLIYSKYHYYERGASYLWIQVCQSRSLCNHFSSIGSTGNFWNPWEVDGPNQFCQIMTNFYIFDSLLIKISTLPTLCFMI